MRKSEYALALTKMIAGVQINQRKTLHLYLFIYLFPQPRSQGFSLFVIGKWGKGPGTGRSHDFQHPDIVGVNKL